MHQVRTCIADEELLTEHSNKNIQNITILDIAVKVKTHNNVDIKIILTIHSNRTYSRSE